VLQAARAGHRVVVPAGNLREACVVPDARVAGAGSLLEVCGHLWGSAPLEFITGTALPAPPATGADLRDVRGQAAAKRALEVAAAGGHSLLLIGPPGSGKSMLAARLPGLLPPLNDAEAIEAAVLRSLGRDARPLEQWRSRPFRAPHHGASAVALIGGGAHPRPGEISLAHHGVLFLDELPEFNRDVLEALREPLETGCVSIARSAHRATFPARFQLVAAMNPCPCGYAGDQQGRCRCTAPQIARYVGRLSGPLVDRIDLHVEVAAVDAASLRRAPVAADGTCEVAARVLAARERQLARAGVLNSALQPSGTEGLADEPAERLLAEAMRRLGMSARGAHRVLRVARTIADLACVDRVGAEHVAEAIGWRRLDRAPATG
jgi:magnesium chelatase family protein